MTTIPNRSVQLVHIQGPLKGKIQDLGDAEINIGRHPDCQVCFPREMTTISRLHARIVREDNRFKIMDLSTNGTYLNGQRVTEAYLKDGDVLMFSEGGAKTSFLTQSVEQPPEVRPVSPSSPRADTSAPSPLKSRVTTPPPAAPGPAARPIPTPVKAPFAIQYGPALKSFQTLPLIIGSGPSCDFVIQHPDVEERHAQIFFTYDRYWVKDLTGRSRILINHLPIPSEAALEPDMQLALSERGPKFRFIGGGRLAEVETPLPKSPAVSPAPPKDTPQPGSKPETLGEKAGNLFKRFFR